jgi:hypothetical protein
MVHRDQQHERRAAGLYRQHRSDRGEGMKDIMSIPERIMMATVVDAFLKEAGSFKNVNFGVVNWGDLHCTDVIQCERMDGRRFIQVIIEEASDTHGLPQYILGRLKARYPGIDFQVRCEW